ncbi:hypothetical protein [Streptomyces sp. CB09001]|nr:hypothetical protein [Streptomyces sp. CB09001]
MDFTPAATAGRVPSGVKTGTDTYMLQSAAASTAASSSSAANWIESSGS